jgi:hypothetical protein
LDGSGGGLIAELSQHLPEVAEENNKKLVTLNDVPADIRIEHLSNASPERYDLLGSLTLHGTDSSKYYWHV